MSPYIFSIFEALGKFPFQRDAGFHLGSTEKIDGCQIYDRPIHGRFVITAKEKTRRLDSL